MLQLITFQEHGVPDARPREGSGEPMQWLPRNSQLTTKPPCSCLPGRVADEGSVALEHLEDQHAQGPPVHGAAVPSTRG